MLVVQLKRFGYDWEANRAIKFDDFFEVRLESLREEGGERERVGGKVEEEREGRRGRKGERVEGEERGDWERWRSRAQRGREESYILLR